MSEMKTDYTGPVHKEIADLHEKRGLVAAEQADTFVHDTGPGMLRYGPRVAWEACP